MPMSIFLIIKLLPSTNVFKEKNRYKRSDHCAQCQGSYEKSFYVGLGQLCSKNMNQSYLAQC